MSTSYHLHGAELHHQTEARTTTRQRTLVAVGQIWGSVVRLEALLDKFADDPGPGTHSEGPTTTPEPGEVGTYCEGRR